MLGFCLANWYKFVAMGLIIALIVLVSVKGFSVFGAILRWFQRRNSWGGWGVFVGMYTLLVALFIPGVAFIMGAGFVFGFWKGLLAVWIGGAVGQALAFLLARYLLKDWVETFVRGRWQKWEYIDKAIELEGWKLVLIMRLSPIIPYNLLNVAMATTRIKFWQFTFVSAIGILYECAVFCYFGSAAKDITSIVSGEAGPAAVVKWIMLGVSVAMCVLGAVFVSVTIKRAVHKAQLHMSSAALSGMADEETGAGIYGSPTALEREAFLGGGGGSGGARSTDASPTFELRAVAGGAGKAPADSDGSPAASDHYGAAKLPAGGGWRSPGGQHKLAGRSSGDVPPLPRAVSQGDVELGGASPLRWRPPHA